MASKQAESLKGEIRRKAQHLGFDLFGVTTPDAPDHLDVYGRWLAAGHHGKMEYLSNPRARQRRADPLQILPECRSILVLGTRYSKPPDLIPHFIEDSQQETQKKTITTGQVSAYAWGSDYHDVLVKRLRELVAFIEGRIGIPFPHRWYTDTGPIMERELAQRAGLGWIGKNTCLIHPKQGSYFFLAELFLGLELEPDTPFTTDHCGTCTRCLDACPTACILPNRTIDSRKCISYLTIELKDSIPKELRPQLGNWIFGCDVCQQVCPWNQRFSTSEGDPAFAARPGLPEPALIEEISLNAQEFSRKFKGSPIKRAKRRGYLRNVAVSLGNNPSAGSCNALIDALLNDPDALVRGHAAWGLARIGGAIAHQALLSARKKEGNDYVQKEIEDALDEFLD